MKDPEYESASLISRMMRDPVRLRRGSWMAALLVSLGGGIAGSGWDAVDAFSAALMAVVWLLVPVVAAGIGMGDAFFLRHAVGQRRVALRWLVSTLAAVVSCALLAAVAGADDESRLVSGGLYFVLTLAVICWLASAVGIAVGRSEGYLSRKIQNVDDRGW